MPSVGSELPNEIKRVREMREVYLSIGASGVPAAEMMRLALDRATEALASGDVVAVLRAYEELRGWSQ